MGEVTLTSHQVRRKTRSQHSQVTQMMMNDVKRLDQEWLKPVKQGTDESEQILANLDKTEQTGQKKG